MHTPYGPGQYYISAFLFSLFGTSIKVLAFEFFVGTAAFVGISYWVFRGYITRFPALLLTFLVAQLLASSLLT